MDFTLIGDTVNVAKRLQEMAGTGQIVVSEAIQDYLLEEFELEERSSAQVKGRQGEVRTYLLCGERVVVA